MTCLQPTGASQLSSVSYPLGGGGGGGGGLGIGGLGQSNNFQSVDSFTQAAVGAVYQSAVAAAYKAVASGLMPGLGVGQSGGPLPLMSQQTQLPIGGFIARLMHYVIRFSGAEIMCERSGGPGYFIVCATNKMCSWAMLNCSD